MLFSFPDFRVNSISNDESCALLIKFLFTLRGTHSQMIDASAASATIVHRINNYNAKATHRRYLNTHALLISQSVAEFNTI